jgi:TorA maturation chaperone TorD
MEATASRVEVAPPVTAEDAARADFYALLATLLHHAPDAKLLGSIAIAPPLGDGDAALARAWAALSAASAVVDPEAVAEEYEALFVGVGVAAVSIYAASYGGGGPVPHRVRIIEDLAALGLAHPRGSPQPEDHFAGLLDAMRVLAGGGAGRGPASLAEQRKFFDDHLGPGLRRFFAAVREAAEANYYRKVAAVGEAFVDIEIESFNLGGN